MLTTATRRRYLAPTTRCLLTALSNRRCRRFFGGEHRRTEPLPDRRADDRTAHRPRFRKSATLSSAHLNSCWHGEVQGDLSFRRGREQRFGVTHKENIKEMSRGVDVLTLSATPIPRTLNMAMSGIRDMSTIEAA